MTISSTVSNNDYTGNGAAADYDFDFKILAATDLLVTVATPAGVLTTLVKDVDYQVNGTSWESGGSITLLDADQAWLTSGNLTTDYSLTLRRVRPLTQQTGIRNQSTYHPELHENAFDHGIMVDQQQQDEIDRSLKAPETDGPMDDLPAAVERASMFLAFDADGDPIASSGGIDSDIPVSAFMETLLDDASAAAARTTLGAGSSADVAAAAAAAAAAQTAAEAAALVGEIKMYGAASSPTKWLLCDGSAVSRTTYAALFAVIGTTFGTGDGSLTFNVPDMKSRMPIGMGAGSGLTTRNLGATGGVETHVHAIPHRHITPFAENGAARYIPNQQSDWADGSQTLTKTMIGVATGGAAASVSVPFLKTGTTDTTNSDATNNMNPFLCLNFIIYAGV